MRRPLIVGNWKMNKTASEARDLARKLREIPVPPGVDVAVCPPFTSIWAAANELAGSGIAIGAQTMHEAEHGAFTGEISAPMLRELGVTFVILGHSERREYDGETDAAIARKVRTALDSGITPIVAVGETAAEHESGHTLTKVEHQTRAALAGLARAEVPRCVIAYEPIWAIGTGLVDTPANANATMAHIRASMPELGDARILYGGSMKGENAAALMAEPNIDGGLVGGASLTAEAFAAVVAAAASHASNR